MESTSATTRLFAAADALLDAMHNGGSVPMVLTKPTASQFTLMKAFTPSELMNAMDMLIRMGFATRVD